MKKNEKSFQFIRVQFRRPLPFLASILLSTILLNAAEARAQTEPTQESVGSKLPDNAWIFLGISGFLPFKDSYRLNYSTSVAGLPIEINGGFAFPIDQKLMVPFDIRYIRRTVNLIPNMSISMVDIEPGVRLFLEKYQPKEFRFYSGASLILARATVNAQYNLSQNGTITGTGTASDDYVNYGIGFDLGLTYQFSDLSAIDFGIHLGILVGSPTDVGGLGDIGGLSIGAAYRIGF